MSRAQGRVVEEIVIDPATPRDEDFRMSEDFLDLTRRVSAALRLARGAAA
jgi:hypothetical protein